MSATKNFYWNEICKMREETLEQEMGWIEEQNMDNLFEAQIAEFETTQKAIMASNMPAFLSLNR